MAIPINLQKQLNAAIAGIHQCAEPLERARRGGELIEYLQQAINQVAENRRRAVAEAVQWPGESMATIAAKLGLSKSAVAKLATSDLRDDVANDLRTRLARGFNPPPLRNELPKK